MAGEIPQELLEQRLIEFPNSSYRTRLNSVILEGETNTLTHIDAIVGLFPAFEVKTNPSLLITGGGDYPLNYISRINTLTIPPELDKNQYMTKKETQLEFLKYCTLNYYPIITILFGRAVGANHEILEKPMTQLFCIQGLPPQDALTFLQTFATKRLGQYN